MKKLFLSLMVLGFMASSASAMTVEYANPADFKAILVFDAILDHASVIARKELDVFDGFVEKKGALIARGSDSTAIGYLYFSPRDRLGRGSLETCDAYAGSKDYCLLKRLRYGEKDLEKIVVRNLLRKLCQLRPDCKKIVVEVEKREVNFYKDLGFRVVAHPVYPDEGKCTCVLCLDYIESMDLAYHMRSLAPKVSAAAAAGGAPQQGGGWSCLVM